VLRRCGFEDLRDVTRREAEPMDYWEISESHYSRVRAYAMSMLRERAAAEDVVQETFLRVQHGLSALREPAKVTSWVLRIAHNLCLDQLRARRSSRIDADADPATEPADGAGGCQQDLERRQMSDCVRQKIDLLPESLRAVVLLNDVEELSQPEIAEILGIEVGNMKVRLHRARKRLREILASDCAFGQDERNVLVCEPKPKE
jgi:RNA polymerase sigma-70 factor, ECF subfamily